MKQFEKLDLLLKALYNTRFQGYYPLFDICEENALAIEREAELRKLAKRLQNDGLINVVYSQEECYGQITPLGIDYCQRDSYAQKGQPVSGF